MDAWVNCSRELDGSLVYSRVRSAGSVGFALTSAAAGLFFQRFGWGGYFVLQALLFGPCMPFLFPAACHSPGQPGADAPGRPPLGGRGLCHRPESPRFRFGLCWAPCTGAATVRWAAICRSSSPSGRAAPRCSAWCRRLGDGIACSAGALLLSRNGRCTGARGRRWRPIFCARPFLALLLASGPYIWARSARLPHLLRRHRGLVHPGGGGRTHPELLHLHGADRYSAVGTVLESGGRQRQRPALGARHRPCWSLCLSLLVFVLFACCGRAYTGAAL